MARGFMASTLILTGLCGLLYAQNAKLKADMAYQKMQFAEENTRNLEESQAIINSLTLEKQEMLNAMKEASETAAAIIQSVPSKRGENEKVTADPEDRLDPATHNALLMQFREGNDLHIKADIAASGNIHTQTSAKPATRQ